MKNKTIRMMVVPVAIIFSVGLVAAGCSDSGNEASGGGNSEQAGGGGAGDATAGQERYKASCASCHGAEAKGLPNLGKDLTTSKFAIGLSDDDLVAFIKKGRPSSDPANTTGVDMPAKGGNPALGDKDLLNIVAYLRTLE